MTTRPGDSDAAARPRARLPRVRFGVRAMLLVVAASALATLAYVEFKDGMPPRFVYRDMPARIDQLRPGMTRASAGEILGIGRPWYRGGLGEAPSLIVGIGVTSFETCYIRPGKTAFAGGPSGGVVHLNFGSDRLQSARFVDESGAVAEMPMTPKPR